MNNLAISRRRFTHMLGAGAAAAAFLRTRHSLAREGVASLGKDSIVRLSSNENPYGPGAKALEAMTNAFDIACRYPDEHNDHLIEAIAKADGVSSDQILLGDGSGEILKLCAIAFTGPQAGKLVAADPTFEALLTHAKVGGAEVVKVPLTKDYAHDLQ